MSVILCTSSYDQTIKFWEATSGQCYHSVQCSRSQVNCLEIAHKNNCLAAGGNGSVQLFHLSQNNKTPLIGNFEGHTGNVVCLGFDDGDDFLYSAGEDCTVRIWDIQSFQQQRCYKVKSTVNGACLHPNQQYLLTCEEDGDVRVWDIATVDQKDALLFSIKIDSPARSIAVSPLGHLCFVGCNNGYVYVYEMIGFLDGKDSPTSDSLYDEHAESSPQPSKSSLSLKLLQKFKAHDNFILKVLVSPDAEMLATASADRTAKIWSIPSDISNAKKGVTIMKTLEGHKKWVWDCSFSTDSGYLVTGSSDGTSKLWDVMAGDELKSYTGHTKAVIAVAVRDDFG